MRPQSPNQAVNLPRNRWWFRSIWVLLGGPPFIAGKLPWSFGEGQTAEESLLALVEMFVPKLQHQFRRTHHAGYAYDSWKRAVPHLRK